MNAMSSGSISVDNGRKSAVVAASMVIVETVPVQTKEGKAKYDEVVATKRIVQYRVYAFGEAAHIISERKKNIDNLSLTEAGIKFKGPAVDARHGCMLIDMYGEIPSAEVNPAKEAEIKAKVDSLVEVFANYFPTKRVNTLEEVDALSKAYLRGELQAD